MATRSIHPQTEEYWGNVNPIGPRACYDEGKRAAETLFFDYHRQHGVPIKVARIFNTYGPRMHRQDGRVVSNFIVQALLDQPITIYGDGSQTRSFCYVDDLIDGLMRLMASPHEVTGPINIGNTREFTILELAKMVIEITGSRSEIVQQAAAGRRSAPAPAGHHQGARAARLGAHGAGAGGPGAHGRLFQELLADEITAGNGNRERSGTYSLDEARDRLPAISI